MIPVYSHTYSKKDKEGLEVGFLHGEGNTFNDEFGKAWSTATPVSMLDTVTSAADGKLYGIYELIEGLPSPSGPYGISFITRKQGHIRPYSSLRYGLSALKIADILHTNPLNPLVNPHLPKYITS